MDVVLGGHFGDRCDGSMRVTKRRPCARTSRLEPRTGSLETNKTETATVPLSAFEGPRHCQSTQQRRQTIARTIVCMCAPERFDHPPSPCAGRPSPATASRQPVTLRWARELWARGGRLVEPPRDSWRLCAAVLDACSRRVVGSLDRCQPDRGPGHRRPRDGDPVRKPAVGTLIHSDQGCRSPHGCLASAPRRPDWCPRWVVSVSATTMP